MQKDQTVTLVQPLLTLKPQSHQIVRFVDRTIGCDLVSYDRSAMFAGISFYNRKAGVYSLRLVVGHMLICMMIYVLLAFCPEVGRFIVNK